MGAAYHLLEITLITVLGVFPGGAEDPPGEEGACRAPYPVEPGSRAQEGSPPFTVFPEADFYTPGSSLTGQSFFNKTYNIIIISI